MLLVGWPWHCQNHSLTFWQVVPGSQQAPLAAASLQPPSMGLVLQEPPLPPHCCWKPKKPLLHSALGAGAAVTHAEPSVFTTAGFRHWRYQKFWRTHSRPAAQPWPGKTASAHALSPRLAQSPPAPPHCWNSAMVPTGPDAVAVPLPPAGPASGLPSGPGPPGVAVHVQVQGSQQQGAAAAARDTQAAQL